MECHHQKSAKTAESLIHRHWNLISRTKFWEDPFCFPVFVCSIELSLWLIQEQNYRTPASKYELLK